MTDINLDTLPLAKGGQALNRVIGTQVDDEGVASLALFPLKTLSAAPGGRIARLTMATTPTEPGEAQPARLTVYTDDGNSYPVEFTIPPGARGFSVADVECEQDAVTPGEASLVRLTVTLDNGQKLAPITLSLPPGKDSLTITDTSVTQGPVEAGKPSKVTVTFTHNDGSRTSYAYDAPPGPEGFVDGTRFVARDHGDMTLPTIHYGPDNSYSITPQSDGNFVAYDDKRNVIFALNDKEGFLGKNKIATTQDIQAAEAALISGTASMAPGDVAGRSLHTNTQAGRPNYLDASGHGGVLAFYDDVTTETKRAKAAEAVLISGTESMAPIDVAGRSLHTNTQAGRPNYLDASGHGGVLAFYDDVTTETKRAKAAEANTVKTQSNDTDHPVDLVVYNNARGELAAHDSQTGLWKYVYPTEQVNNKISQLLPLSGGTISGTISTQKGGVLLEAVAPNTTGRLVKQIFSITGKSENKPFPVIFPQKFAAPPVGITAISTAETTKEGPDYDWNRFVCIENEKTYGGPTVTESQIMLCLAWDGSYAHSLMSIRNYKIWIEVTGVME